MKNKILVLIASSASLAAAAHAAGTEVADITTAVTGVSGLVTTLIGLGVTVLTWRLIRKYVSKA